MTVGITTSTALALRSALAPYRRIIENKDARREIELAVVKVLGVVGGRDAEELDRAAALASLVGLILTEAAQLERGRCENAANVAAARALLTALVAAANDTEPG